MSMYAWLTGRYVRLNFARIGRGDYRPVLRGMAPDVHHRFAGDHALGGERHDKEAMQRWFERLTRLCPSIDFTVHTVTVSGPPWHLTVAAEWTALVTPAAGPIYLNEGVHVMEIRRGRVSRLFAYEDGEAVAAACRIMADFGVTEAAAPPITS